MRRSVALAVAVLGVAGGLRADESVPPKLTQVAKFEHQVTGVSVSKAGRIFVNFPRWSEDAPVSVGEVVDGKVVPFPNAEWNAYRNAKASEFDPMTHFVCVQSVVVDPQDNLWVVDAAAPGMGPIVKGGPKLVKIDLKANRVEKTIPIPEGVALTATYLNDIRFRLDGKMAYVTDSGARGALIVVDLETGTARRVLDGDPSTQVEKGVKVKTDGKELHRPDGRSPMFSADGIAISKDGKTLYWQALTGRTLYQIPTSALDDEKMDPSQLSGKVQPAGENGVADGLIIGEGNKLYVTSPEDDSVKVRDLGDKQGQPKVLVQDKRLRWPDTFSIGPDGMLYVTTSHIQDSKDYNDDAPRSLPTELWKLPIK